MTSSYVVRGENGFFVLDGQYAADADRASRFRYLSQAKQVVEALNRSGIRGGGWGVWELQPQTTPVSDPCTGLTLRVVSDVVRDYVSSFREEWNSERREPASETSNADTGCGNARVPLATGLLDSAPAASGSYALQSTRY